MGIGAKFGHMLETPVYVAVLDKLSLLSENLTTADNQQERLIIMERPRKIPVKDLEASLNSAVSLTRKIRDDDICSGGSGSDGYSGEEALRDLVRELNGKVPGLNLEVPPEPIDNN